MSHRDQHHAPGSVERGNDWLDGALAGWLLFIAISSSPYAWNALRAGGGAAQVAYELAAPLLALAAIFPLLRFMKLGWMLAVACLTLMAVRAGMSLAEGTEGWRAASAFLVVHLAGLAYLLWIVPEFWPKAADADAVPAAPSDASATESAPSASATPASTGSARTPRTAGATSRRAADPAPAPDGPTPAMQALAAIHHRIVAAGSACAVTPVSVRAEAGRFGVTPAALRTEGLALYRTFLQHFMGDGSLSADEERELICLERALDLDDDGVWRMRAEAGLVGGSLPPAPILSVLNETMPEAVAEDAGRVQTERISAALMEDEARTIRAAAPEPSAQAGITVAEPRIHSPGSSGGTTPPVVQPAAHVAEIRVDDRAVSPPSAPGVPDVTPDGTDALADYEEHELGQLLRWAGIRALPAGAPPRAALERLRALHRTTTEPLEACATDQPLEPGEQCLATRAVELFRGGAGAAPAGAPADLPGPLLDPRTLLDGGVETDADLSAYERAGPCRFVLTERRLLLVGRSGQQSALALSRVRAVRPFRNGLQVQPHRGGPVFLGFTDGVDDLAMRIDRAARDLRA